VLSAAKMEELENKITLLSEELRLLENGSKSTARGTARVKSKGAIAIKNTFTPHPKPGRDKPDIAETESQTYKLASDHFYARRYSKAIGFYDDIISKYPKGIYADNAMYWKGECHFAMGNYAKAIASYQRVFSIPNSEKSDDAQFKIGLSYMRMGEKQQAVNEFKKLLSLYPDSEYVGRARQELKKL
jgi:tol-pal system protein YbgF